MSNEISIEDMNILSNPKGSIKAYFSLVINGIKIKDFKIIQSNNDAAWVAVPSRSYQDKEGKTKFFNTIEWPDEIKNAASKIALEQFKK